MAKVLIYTSVFGDYDSLKSQPEQSIDCKFLHFRQPHEELGDNPRLQAKYYKLLLHRILGAESPFDYTIWVDGSVQITSPHFAEYMVSQAKDSWCMFSHPWRDCIYDETEEACDMVKYLDQPMREQMSHYASEGMPRKFGMTSAGIICRNSRNLSVVGLDEMWWREIMRWGIKDQIPLQYVLWKTGQEILRCDKPLFGNGLFTIHASHRAEEYKKLKR